MTTKDESAYLLKLDIDSAKAQAEQAEEEALASITIPDTARGRGSVASWRAQQWKYVERLWDRVVELESKVKP